jgi:hypothetical protein
MKRVFHTMLATMAVLSSCLCSVAHAVDADLHFHAVVDDDPSECHSACAEDTVPCDHPEPDTRAVSDTGVDVPESASGEGNLCEWTHIVLTDFIANVFHTGRAPPALPLAGRTLHRHVCRFLI